ncbi:MAG: glycosyltransferase family 2 protein [Coriobacteriia bacterium]|nr:glycosyltransferase family 2 protein [Coriobacteriia bacterium]
MSALDELLAADEAEDSAPVIVALVPARNEAERISATVCATLHIPGVTRVMVADDNSEDDTARLAEQAGAKVLRLRNRLSGGSNPDIEGDKPIINIAGGKGAALEYLAKFAEDADIILLLDGDLGVSAGEADKLLAPVLAGEADMTIAQFPRPVGKAGFGLVKGLARRGIASMGGGWQAQAPLSGQRCLRRACLDEIRPFEHGYGVEVALTVRALRAGMRLLEVPTTMTHAATGRDLSGFWHRGKQFLHVTRTLLKLHFKK